MTSELDKIVDGLRNGTVDLAYLNKPAQDAQIQAMVAVCLRHEHDSPNIEDIGNCSCGWRTPIIGKHFEVLEREFLAHIMADIVDRVFSRPTNPLTGRHT